MKMFIIVIILEKDLKNTLFLNNPKITYEITYGMSDTYMEFKTIKSLQG